MATIEYLSWSAFLITSDAGVRVVIDPWLAGNAERGVAPASRTAADLADADLILASHVANDHFGQALEILGAGHAVLAGWLDARLLAEDAGLDGARTVLLVPNSPYTQGDVTVIPVEAKHHSNSRLKNGQWLFGKPLSFFVRVGDHATVYHSGDTAISLDLALYGDLYEPTMALLGVGGLPHPGRQAVVEMSPREGALAARMLGAGTAVPCHFIPGSAAGPAFVEEVRELAPEIQAVIMEPGQTMTVPATRIARESVLDWAAGRARA